MRSRLLDHRFDFILHPGPWEPALDGTVALDLDTLLDDWLGHENPKAPRHTIYPAGSNAPGALHFGIDLARPSDYIRRVMPDWEEPPVHMDLVTLDSTVTAGENQLIDRGFLCALRDKSVVELAAHYGDPVELLEAAVF